MYDQAIGRGEDSVFDPLALAHAIAETAQGAVDLHLLKVVDQLPLVQFSQGPSVLEQQGVRNVIVSA